MRPLIFLIEDNPQSCRIITACLERSNYQVKQYFSADIISQIEDLRPSVVLIDKAVQSGNALELCGMIRRRSGTQGIKVILLTDRASADDYLLGFNAGADDCLTRPVLPGELLARVEAVLRRGHRSRETPPADADPVLKLGDMELNLLALRVYVSGETIPTTILEFRLLEYMARNQGRVFTRDQLLDAVWGQERFITPRSVDACVRRLRNKLESARGGLSFLKTVRGVGYYLESTPHPLRNSAALATVASSS